MAHPAFAKAAQFVTTEAVRETLMAMVDIQSPTGHEAAVARYLVERMRQAGMRAEIQPVAENRSNAVGHLYGHGDGTNLLFTGHMDTSYSGEEDFAVSEGFKAKAVHRDGWIWGLGANNMKSGLAAAVVAIEAIVRAGVELAGDVSLGGVVGEIEKAPAEEFQGAEYSGYGVGSKHLVTHGVTADYALLAEPTALRVCTANMGCIWCRITIESGSMAHSSLTNRPGIVNAITLMHGLQTDIAEWARLYQERHPFRGEHPNVTMAAIRGGAPWRLSRNPMSCSVYLDIRTVPGQTVDGVKRELRAVLRSFAARTGTPEAILSLYVTDPPMAIDETLPVVEALRQARQQVMGEAGVSMIRRPGADAVHFTRYDVPCVVLGPGGRMHPDARGSMHAVGEHVLVQDVVTAARIYLALALDLCNRPAPRSEP